MASTISIRNSMNFVKPYLKNQPLEVTGMEPAVTAGNMVLGFMLGPPLRWRFNRKNISFAINNGSGTDYVQALSTFGFMEGAWLVDGSNNAMPLKGNVMLIPNEGVSSRPEQIAPQYDDNAGNITFRFDKTPDVSYTAFVDFQQKAPLLSSPASQWTPVPDEFGFIYNYGFLCLLCLLVNDARFPIFESYFISRLLAAQDGLDAQARDIFLGNWANAVATMKRGDMRTALGNQPK